MGIHLIAQGGRTSGPQTLDGSFARDRQPGHLGRCGQGSRQSDRESVLLGETGEALVKRPLCRIPLRGQREGSDVDRPRLRCAIRFLYVEECIGGSRGEAPVGFQRPVGTFSEVRRNADLVEVVEEGRQDMVLALMCRRSHRQSSRGGVVDSRSERTSCP